MADHIYYMTNHYNIYYPIDIKIGTAKNKGDIQMKIIKLDASKWQTGLDFYDAILPALGAPKWHGRGVNALVESMIWGEINEVEPPYAVEIYSTKNLPADVIQQMTWVHDFIIEARAEFNVRTGHDVEVSFKMFD